MLWKEFANNNRAPVILYYIIEKIDKTRIVSIFIKTKEKKGCEESNNFDNNNEEYFF